MMKDLRKQVKEAELRLAKALELQKSLNAKQMEMQDSRLAIERRIVEAKQKKKAALVLHVKGAVSSDAVDRAQNDYQEALGDLDLLNETIEAVEVAKKECAQEVTSSSHAVQVAKTRFWQAVAKDLTDALLRLAGDQVGLLWAAKLKAGGTDYQRFLSQLFPMPSLERLNGLNAKLEKKYGTAA